MTEHASSDPKRETIPLEEALKKAEEVLAVRLDRLSPDAIAQAVALGGKVVWKEAPDWEVLDDLDIAAMMGLEEVSDRPLLLVVTEASFSRAGGAFLIDGEDLNAFVRGHHATYGECFFNGDVVIIDLDQAATWLFHHEGAHTFLPGRM